MLPTIEASFPVWIGLGIAIALQWLIRLVMLNVEYRRRRLLGSRSHPGQHSDLPRLTMLVAAKDEEEHIGACVNSLLKQDYPNLEVIVIDDRSDDRTPMILKRLEEESNGRLRVISILELEDGWFGKNNAMREGVAASGGDWLCFTDADCRMTSVRTLSVAMQEAQQHNVDFLTMTPVLEMNTLWEKITQPACAQTLMFWFQPSRVNDPNRATAYANGAFMLMSRDCYLTIGGHDRVKTEVNEDIQLARHAKQAGLKLRMVENDDLCRAQMYGSALQSFRGWSRILFGSLKSGWRLCFSLSASVLFTLLPPVCLIISLTGLAQAGSAQATGWTLAVGVWLGAVLLCQAAAWRFYSFLQTNRCWSLTYVLGAAVTIAMLLNALLKQAGIVNTTWRGTTYRRNERVDVPV
jgi:GT2 family glycosyltransferase